MRHTKIFVGVGLLLMLAATAWGSNTDGVTQETSFWIGGHLIDTSDYYKKVGEYHSFRDDIWPEFGLTYNSTTPNSRFFFKGHYFDRDEMFGMISTKVSDVFTGKFSYNSFQRQTGQDLLENIEAREFLPSVPKGGGKILTHDITDPDADYNYNRKEILSEFSALLSRENNLRLTVAHRAILKEGTEQLVSSNHCFSCHLESKSAKVEDRTHDFQAGLDTKTGNLDVGYKFGYRHYESTAPTPMAYYDDAKHPTLGTAGAEFGSRLNYDGTSMPIDAKPKIEKTTHKARIKGAAGNGQFASSFVLSKATNKLTDLSAKSWAGVFNYAVPISPKTRLVAKASVTSITADDPFVDVNTFREGKPGAVDFDYIRYSALDRTTADFTAQVFHRLNPKTTLSFLAGYNRVAREDYPVVGDGTTSSTIIGQAKVRYRKGMKLTTSFKYRFEKTSDPFVSGKGLFEAPGDALEPVHYGYDPTGDTAYYGYFYYQREDLRYQSITTEPTDYHEVSLASTFRPTAKTTLNLKVNATMDKNGDLDSLDVKHNKLNGNLSFTLMPDLKWTLSGGVSVRMEKSRGPIAVALFDG